MTTPAELWVERMQAAEATVGALGEAWPKFKVEMLHGPAVFAQVDKDTGGCEFLLDSITSLEPEDALDLALWITQTFQEPQPLPPPMMLESATHRHQCDGGCDTVFACSVMCCRDQTIKACLACKQRGAVPRGAR